MASPTRSACANEGPERRLSCGKDGTMECSNCHLVKYCSKKCQEGHWPVHKQDCRSELLKRSWRPSWDRECREPTFATFNAMLLAMGQGFYGQRKFLWGNVPALDIINMEANEGLAYNKPLNLLFAASGDLRNVVKTVASLPERFSSGLSVDINDRDMDIVARNIIFLLLFYTVEDGVEAAECVLHLWYSALIPQTCLPKLEALKSLIEDVCSVSRHRSAHTILAKTWTFAQGRGSLRIVLTKEKWESLLSYLEVPTGLTTDRAEQIRSTIMNAPQRIDHLHRKLFEQLEPSWRICTYKFRQDGILLPFGQPRNQHTIPNPTFFQTSYKWPMMDSADPLDGWPIPEVFATPTGARDDVNGKLYNYIRSTFIVFHSRLRALDIKFRLFQGDIQAVVPLIDGSTPAQYDRIEVSNISDGWYLGIENTLALFRPWLCPKQSNPHATLITLFLNAVQEEISDVDDFIDMKQTTMQLVPFLSQSPPTLRDARDADYVRIVQARYLFRDGPKYFNRYKKHQDFCGAGEAAGMEMKPKNTIVDAWPLRLKRRPQDNGAQEEFRQLLGSGHTGVERYVEWQRSS